MKIYKEIFVEFKWAELLSESASWIITVNLYDIRAYEYFGNSNQYTIQKYKTLP